MPIVSNPKKLTVPDEASYPINRLWLFDWQDRVSWERAFGEQAQPAQARGEDGQETVGLAEI